MDNKNLIDKLEKDHVLEKDQFVQLIKGQDLETEKYLFKKAQKVARENYSNKIYIRGLIELTNYCKNDCFYCGIRCSNKKAQRYRLTKEQILHCCEIGYGLGFRTFVLQGGEDNAFSDEKLTHIVSAIRNKYPDCAITLSLGERSRESYQSLYDAGANRYLLRHETANSEHYTKLHPANLTLEHRQECLFQLREIGYQVGSGFMVGSPYQTDENLTEDLLFLHKLQPHMVGIGPFIHHKDTPFCDELSGTSEKTVFILAILRLMFPKSLLPATTALGTIDSMGREKAVLAGANVVMPNLSPSDVRSKYLLYNDKIATGDEAAESLNNLKKRFEKIGYEIVVDIGNAKSV